MGTRHLYAVLTALLWCTWACTQSDVHGSADAAVDRDANLGQAGTGAAGHAANSCGLPLSEPVGRPAEKACATSPLAQNLPDASTTPCSIDADCSGGLHCFHGECGADSCHQDSDCDPGSACACAADYYGGNALHGNLCIKANCRIDADCQRAGGTACSPSYGERCGATTGYFCHSKLDTCQSNSDCCGQLQTCLYAPELGHWACQAVTVCNG
jgi:hypothetical protein